MFGTATDVLTVGRWLLTGWTVVAALVIVSGVVDTVPRWVLVLIGAVWLAEALTAYARLLLRAEPTDGD